MKESLARTLLISLLCVILGAGVEWFFRGRDAVTKDDLQLVVTPLQQQLSSIQSKQQEQSDKLDDLNNSLALVKEDMKLKGLDH